MRAIHLAPTGMIEVVTDSTPVRYPDLNRRLFPPSDLYGEATIEVVSCLSLAEAFGSDSDGWVRYPKAIMLIDENGIAQGLPYNPAATALYAPQKDDQAHRGGQCAIFGDAWLIGNVTTDEGIDWGDLSGDINGKAILDLVTRRLS